MHLSSYLKISQKFLEIDYDTSNVGIGVILL